MFFWGPRERTKQEDLTSFLRSMKRYEEWNF